jgi:hypothetical protein
MGMFCSETPGPDNIKSATTEFHDQNAAITCTVASEMDPTRAAADDQTTDFSNFFERPVVIKSYDWAVGAALDDLFYPWALWMANPRVANRLSNFRGFRGNLHVKVMLNGNSFYWGKALLSYTGYDGASIVGLPFHTHIYGNPLSLMPASTRPHIWLDPTTSQGGEMVLPFYAAEDSLYLPDVNFHQNMGKLWLTSIGLLEQSNNLSNAVRVTVMAWATDVHLSGPTQVNVGGLLPQSGDEYGTGPISRPANLVAAVAGKLSGIPTIRPYAMATQMAAGTIGSWASRIGFSRPRTLEVTKPVKVWQTGDIATADQEETCTTLAFTNKQEVSVDPRLVGLSSQDELSFEYLAKKPCFLTTTTWSLADAPYKVLFSAPVTPMIFNLGTIAGSSLGVGLTPTAWIGLPFDYWRGSMTYRFQLAASAYHKGRLLVVWDSVNGSAAPELNTVNSKIIDISETRDFSVTVGWGSQRPALRLPNPIGSPSVWFSTSTPSGSTPTTDNGVITVYVLNDLITAGTNTNPVTMLVHTSSDDLEVWSPNDSRIARTTYYPQSGMLEAQSGVLPDANEEQVADAPEASYDVGDLGSTGVMDKGILFLSGEKVNSFRTCMKRFGLRRRVGVTLTQAAFSTVYSSMYTSAYALLRGDPTLPGGGTNAPMSVMGYVTPCFAGWRGSVRMKYFQLGDTPAGGYAHRGDTPADTGFTNLTEFTDHGVALSTMETFSGAQYTNPVSGGNLEFEIPWYADVRFSQPAKEFDRASYALGARVTFTTTNPSNAEVVKMLVMDELQAIGEDYNLFFFLGVPPIWPKT